MSESLKQQYLELAQSLLPPGPAWNKTFATYNEDGSVKTDKSNLTKLLEGLADEFSTIHQRSLDLIREANPLSVLETINGKYKEAGLPDSCSYSSTSIEGMRLEILQKWRSVGGTNINFLQSLLDEAGYEAQVAEPAYGARCGNQCNLPVSTDANWDHIMLLNIKGLSDIWFRTGQSRAQDYFHEWETSPVFCYINRIKPAHVKVYFNLIT
jgi:uncharacterized protein YmfQ (DUF2313 family)